MIPNLNYSILHLLIIPLIRPPTFTTKLEVGDDFFAKISSEQIRCKVSKKCENKKCAGADEHIKEQ